MRRWLWFLVLLMWVLALLPVLIGASYLNSSGSYDPVTGTVAKQTCTFIVGADNGVVLVDADLGPQGRQCFINTAGTLLEVTVSSDAGTPNIIPRRNRGGTTANIVSSALATAASGGLACSKTSVTTCLDGTTTASGTLQNTALNAGDWLELASGSASTAKRMSIAVTWSVP